MYLRPLFSMQNLAKTGRFCIGDEIVKKVHFPVWQATTQGERLVQKELRRMPVKYKMHTDQELFDKEQGYIRQYY